MMGHYCISFRLTFDPRWWRLGFISGPGLYRWEMDFGPFGLTIRL